MYASNGPQVTWWQLVSRFLSVFSAVLKCTAASVKIILKHFQNITLSMILYIQTHYMSCPGDPDSFPGITCKVFEDPHPMTMALSVLVTIELCNALNR